MNSMAHHNSGNGNGSSATNVERLIARAGVHPSWQAFIRYCRELQHGEIERLKIQDGLPVLAEVIREKIKFTT
jgi:hypothetical protein